MTEERTGSTLQSPEDTPAPPPGSDTPRRARVVLARVVTGLAALAVLVVLVAPTETGQLSPVGFVRIPVEAVLGVLLVLFLPARARRATVVVGGVVLGLLAVIKVLDIGFFAVLDRAFDPVLDWSFLEAAIVFLTGSDGRTAALGSAVGALALALTLLVLVTLSVIRLATVVLRHRAGATRAAAALGALWLACALVGVHLEPGVPMAAHVTVDRVAQIRASLHDRETFAAQLEVDAFRDMAATRLLTALRGKDVVIALVESYGRVAVDEPAVASVLTDGRRRLAAAGYDARSAYLTSPTAGGGSWLAQATLLSGLWVNNQHRYDTLMASDRLTLCDAFRRAGWRTVGVMPGVILDWPQGAYFGFDRIYAAADLGYQGPNFSFATMPDQYTLSAFERLERSAADRAPLMAVIPLISSHAPWNPVPASVDWSEVGDGSGFHAGAGAGDPTDVVLHRDSARVRADYARAVGYSLTTLVSYVENFGDDDLVLVVLGDHQPAPVITGDGAGREAPVTIIARDPAVLDRVATWGWSTGLHPGADAPIWPMDAFRDRFLASFSP